MVFSSLAFIFRFMPLFFLCYFLTPKPFRNIVLFLGSIIFYAVGEPVYVLLMLFSILVNFMLCVHMAREKRARQRKWLLGCILILDFGMLFLFKYYDFAAQNVNLLLHREAVPMLNLTLPLGISFYTFQIASYAADIYRRKMKHTGTLLEFATYVSMFPQLIAGPIVQYQEVSSELESRKTTLYSIEKGLEIFCFGLGAKVLLANKIWIFWNQIQGIGYANLSTPAAWMGAVAYSFHIYFDFWGYSLMAIGLGHMLGFHLPRNFESPYMVKSVTEFWRKWHMTLGRFFREYVYIPLGGSRNGRFQTLRNLAVVFITTGIWHGAGWNYIIWGGINGFCVIFERIIRDKKLYHILPDMVKWITTMGITLFSWQFFRFQNITEVWNWMKVMFGVFQFDIIPYSWQYYFDMKIVTLIVIGIFGSTLFGSEKIGDLSQKIFLSKVGFVVKELCLLILFIMSILFMVNSTYSPFIYFQY